MQPPYPDWLQDNGLGFDGIIADRRHEYIANERRVNGLGGYSREVIPGEPLTVPGSGFSSRLPRNQGKAAWYEACRSKGSSRGQMLSSKSGWACSVG